MKKSKNLKSFYQMDNIGKVKYTINYHNGIEKHKDGSPFFGIKTFTNKKKLNNFKKELLKSGYVEK